MTRRRSLATRLALAIGLAVSVVILAAGTLVGVGVIARFDAFLATARAERYTQAASVAADLAASRGSLALEVRDLRELAVVAGGAVEIRDTEGHVLSQLESLPGVGSGPPGTGSATGPGVSFPIIIDGVTVGVLVVYPLLGSEMQAGPAPAGFRESAGLILSGAGVGLIVACVVIGWLLARRLTDPLRDLAAATRRIGAGDLSARVALPQDAEGHDLGLAFNTMAEDLERSELLRRRAASDIAHELATPVTVLVGRLQGLADGVIAATASELATTRDAADEVRRLVTDLGDLAAAEGASLQRSVERVDLVDVVRAAVTTARTLVSAAGVELTGPRDDEGPILVSVDQRQIGRCLANLLTNAAAYTPRGGTARVSVCRREACGGSARQRHGCRDCPGSPPPHL
jgi:two-component system sensor histidine kinase BaeS